MLLTPETVHYGLADAVLTARAQTLQAAFLAHSKRFKGRLPQPQSLPKAVWINPPDELLRQAIVQPGEDLQ